VEFQRRLVDIFMGADVKASGRRRSLTRLIASGSRRMPPKIAPLFWEVLIASKALKTELLSHTYNKGKRQRKEYFFTFTCLRMAIQPPLEFYQ